MYFNVTGEYVVKSHNDKKAKLNGNTAAALAAIVDRAGNNIRRTDSVIADLSQFKATEQVRLNQANEALKEFV